MKEVDRTASAEADQFLAFLRKAATPNASSPTSGHANDNSFRLINKQPTNLNPEGISILLFCQGDESLIIYLSMATCSIDPPPSAPAISSAAHQDQKPKMHVSMYVSDGCGGEAGSDRRAPIAGRRSCGSS